MNNNALQIKRGTAARWAELNPILANGEPGFEYDSKKLKIGDGHTAWNELPYIGENSESELYSVDYYSELPDVGVANCIYKVNNDRLLYQWNTNESKYELLNQGGDFDPSKIKLINGGNANG